jgi:hypothetical protein
MTYNVQREIYSITGKQLIEYQSPDMSEKELILALANLELLESEIKETEQVLLKEYLSIREEFKLFNDSEQINC